MRPSELTQPRSCFARGSHNRATIAGVKRPIDNVTPVDRQVKLSSLMPVYNEARTIESAVETVLSTEYPCEFELIVVDDGSTDGTAEILNQVTDPRAVVQTHPRNLGKGAALHTAAAIA